MNLRKGGANATARRWALPIALAIGLRALTLTPGLPYIGYIDEGHVLHPTAELLRSGGWDPGWYGYPPLTFYLISSAAKGVDLLERAVTPGRSLVKEIPSRDEVLTPAGRRYDIIGPSELIVTGRFLMLFLSVGTVLVSGLLGGALFGPRTGWVAALMVACCPAFVTRGSFVMVDTPATFFATLALYLIVRFRWPDRESGDVLTLSAHALAFGTGLAAALAAASKYSTIVLVPIAVAAVLAAAPTVARAMRSSLAVAAGVLTGLALGAPTLALRFHEIADALKLQTWLYGTYGVTPTYWRTAAQAYELGIPLLLCSAAGLWQMLRRPDQRAIAWTWLAFAAFLTLPLLRFDFQPFRNLLPLCPFVVVAGAHFIVGLFERPEGDRAAGSARWIGIVACAAVAVSFGAGLLRLNQSLVRRDSRVAAIDWLVQRVQPGDQVLVLRDLAILPSEIRRLPARTRVVSCKRLKKLAASTPSAYLVVGGTQGGTSTAGGRDAGCVPISLATPVASFGSVPTPPYAEFWRTNLEALRILKTVDPASLSPSPELPATQRHF